MLIKQQIRKIRARLIDFLQYCFQNDSLLLYLVFARISWFWSNLQLFIPLMRLTTLIGTGLTDFLLFNIWCYFKYINHLGAVHKLRRQDFEDFGPHCPPLLRSQVYYISLCSSIDIWPTPPPPLLVYVVYEWPLGMTRRYTYGTDYFAIGIWIYVHSLYHRKYTGCVRRIIAPKNDSSV